MVIHGNLVKLMAAEKKTGVADIELKLGYDYLDCDTCHLDGYFGIVIPTSTRPKGEYLFEAITGHNRHAGFMMGASYGMLVWENCDKMISWEIDTNSRYLFRNTQTRSFDLKNRPWSRYMLAIKDQAAATAIEGGTFENALANATPGINVFTKKMHITPRFSFNINTAFVYENGCGFHAELGYNFWARQAERAKLKDEWTNEVALLNVDPNAYTGGTYGSLNVVNRLSNVGDDNTGTGVEYSTGENGNAIRLQDLNLQSAAHPAAMSHIVFLTAGYEWDDYCYPIYAGFGGSYEFSGVNTAVNRWTLWGKFGVSI